MQYFRSIEIAKGVYRITDCTVTSMYLVVGEKMAAVLDTGAGCGNLYEYVQTLTDKPVIVLISHGHVDHALGADAFPKVYMNTDDFYVYREHQKFKFRKQYARLMQLLRGIKGIQFFFERVNWMAPRKEEDFEPLHVGDTFDLGGEIIEVCEGKGHTKGCVSFLLRNHRLLMTGDACNSNVFLYDWYSTSVEEYKEAMENLKNQTDGKYDKILLCHGNDKTLTVEPGMIEGAIWLCEAILAGKDRHIKTKQFGGITAYSTKKTGKQIEDIGDHSACNILYNNEFIKTKV